jgi:hypothetical protein
MKYSIIPFVATLILSISGVQAGPLPVGTDTMPLQGGPIRPTPEWDKAHPKLTTAQTPNVVHSCNKDLHSVHCVKKCVVKATELQPSGLPPIWHVRGGTAFPARDKQAESTMLGQLASPKLSRQRQVQATVITAP